MERAALRVVEPFERPGKHAIDDLVARLQYRATRVGDGMLDASADTGGANDQALGDETVRKRSERLVAHEGLARERMRRPTRMAVDRPQSIPLRQSRAHGAQGSIGRKVVPVLGSLDCAAELLREVHASMISQLVYINMLT